MKSGYYIRTIMRTIVRNDRFEPKRRHQDLTLDAPGGKGARCQPALSFALPGLCLGLVLSGCGEMPAARTNCWTAAASGGPEVSQAAISPITLAAPETTDPSKCD